MTWRDDWNLINARLIAFEAIVGAFWNASGVIASDHAQQMAPPIHAEVRWLRDKMRAFVANHSSSLPDGVRDAVERFAQAVPNAQDVPAIAKVSVRALLMRSELDFLLRDLDSLLFRGAERAFTHLQRSLVVDEVLRGRWNAAFDDREEQCEKLGATHLLLHGIWAFKANADGGRTDLVLGDDLQVTDDVRAAANGLVLTEWKLVRDGDDWNTTRSKAMKQAQQYTAGILAGFELSQTRYLVLVSKQGAITQTESVLENDYRYRTVHIVIEAMLPSQAARSHR